MSRYWGINTEVPKGIDQSYSELEYDTAVALGIKRLVFLAPDNFPVQAHLIEPDDKRTKQRSFRERVKNDRLVTFFDSDDHLGRLLLQAIHNSKDEMTRYAPSELKPGAKTWLLFNYITSQAGFDTGVAVSNVSADPLGTTPQAGSVVLHFYGMNGPGTMTTTIVLPGTVFSTLATSVSPNFTGYIIAECDSYPARGYAFITDVGARTLATGYVAEIIKIEGAVTQQSLK